MRALAVIAACVAVAAAAAGCGGTSRVPLPGAWPERPPRDYGAVKNRWTRHAIDRRSANEGFDLVIEVYATLKSPEWRAAYVAEMTRRANLSPEARAQLEAEQRREAEEVWELEVLVATRRGEWNDLDRGARSIWRVSLVGDDGREVLPLSVKLDLRPRDVIASWFDDLKPFYRPYVVTFPRVAPDGRPLVGEGSSRLALRIGSALGAVELVW